MRRSCTRAAFTVLELVIATLIFLMIMGATLAVFFGTSKDHDELTRDLEINEKVVRALDRMGQDVREASVVELPPLISADQVPPPFVHRSPEVSTGRILLVSEKPTVNAAAQGINAVRERTHWYLDRPKTVGKGPTGAPVTTYSLFRTVETTPAERPYEVISGVSELVVWRSMRDTNLGPAGAGAGPGVVYVALKIANPRERADKKLSTGYEVQFQTCFAVRGKDIGTRRGSGSTQP